jgi:hypothetical protein
MRQRDIRVNGFEQVSFAAMAPLALPTQKVFVLKVMTHAESDDDKWKDECGCFEPPPPPEKKKAARTKRPTRAR